MKNIKVLVLFSGGLDSVITVKLLQEQGIHVTALFIQNGFRVADNTIYLKTLSKKLNVELVIIDKQSDFFTMLKNPIYGYGSAINPCVDCHALIANIAEQYRIKYDYDFIATGDVLGQRGFSQTSIQLKKVISIIDNPDKILRPLSAKKMKKTKMEITGLVDRDQLLSIIGKSRRVQYKLLNYYGLKIEDVESPAGGCLLAEQNFKNNIEHLISKMNLNDFHLMKYGRHLTVNGFKLILSRNVTEHKAMIKYNGTNFIFIKTNNIKSPIAYIEKDYFINNSEHDILVLMKKFSKIPLNFDFKIIY